MSYASVSVDLSESAPTTHVVVPKASILTPPELAETLAAIRATHTLVREVGDRGIGDNQRPSDAQERTMLVARGSRQIHLLDIQTLDVQDLPPLPFPSLGSAALTPDGRLAFVPTEGGWLHKLDLERRQWVAHVQTGSNSGKPLIAVSGDGRWVAVAHECAHTLLVLDTELKPIKLVPIRDRDAKFKASVMAIHTAASRNSFILVLRDIAELWEISYDPRAPEIPIGVIHDFQYREGAFVPGFLNPARTTLPQPVADYIVSPDSNEVMVAAMQDQSGTIVHLDTRRRIGRWDTAAPTPQLAAGHAWTRASASMVVAAPTRSGNGLAFIEMESGMRIGHTALVSNPARVQSHAASGHLWILPSQHPSASSAVALVGKQAPEAVHALPSPVQGMPTDLTFTNDGRLALVYYSGPNGGIVVYDSTTAMALRHRHMQGQYRVLNSTAAFNPATAADPVRDYCTP